MTNIAAHVRIFDASPADDLVTKRTTAIKDIVSKFSKSTSVANIFMRANEIAMALASEKNMPASLAADVEASVKKSAKAFLGDGQSLQLMVCAALGAIEALDVSRSNHPDLTTLDVLGIGLWSALAFQKPRKEPKVEALRTELLTAARTHTVNAATLTRRRLAVGELKIDLPAEYESGAVAQAISNGIEPVTKALRANSAADREELDLLWWVLSDWSTLLQTPLSSTDRQVATAISAGIEAGKLLRRMPDEAHRHLVLRSVQSTDNLSLKELIDAVGADRESLAEPFKDYDFLVNCQAVFPLANALLSGKASPDKSATKWSVADWAARALLESSALEVTAHLPTAKR